MARLAQRRFLLPALVRPVTVIVPGLLGRTADAGGMVVASYQMAGDVGAVTGPIAVGFLVDSVSYQAAFLLAAGVGEDEVEHLAAGGVGDGSGSGYRLTGLPRAP